MPRAPRIQLEGALYYVTSKVIEGQSLFNEKEDYLMYEELLNKYRTQHGFKLFAFSLMPSHVHLLVETRPGVTLSEVMHNITSAYTKYYNKKFSRRGHLFRGRFRAVVIEKEPNLLRLTRYVHLNPVHLGLVSDASEYQYSTYLNYIKPNADFVSRVNIRDEVSEVSAYLNKSNYSDFMKEDCAKENNAIHKDLKKKIFLGSEQFERAVYEKLGKNFVAKELKIETEEKARSVFTPIVLGVVAIILAGFAVLYANRLVQNIAVAPLHVVASVDVPKNALPVEADKITGLDKTVWRVKFVAGTPFQSIDNITFDAGKMTSENMSLNGYQSSNYSLTEDDGRIIWETMQESGGGVALWRGQVEGDQMKGVLSLRPKEGKPQDFSFVSLKFARQR